MKLGMIGMSEGNGHPYSWSAIINGEYNVEAMKNCGYATIPAYLGANRDTIGIDGAKVTHIWCQDQQISESCAKASCIDNVVDNIEDLIGKVEAVLLARDDPENHVKMAKPFIDADVPLFIDKPLAFNRKDLDYFTEQSSKGKFIMSCSAFRYAPAIQSAREKINTLGQIELAVAVGRKDLRKYAIHYLEGLFSFLGDPKAVSVKHVSKQGKDILYIEFENGILATLHVFMGISPIAGGSDLYIYGSKGNLGVSYGGAYPTFRNHIIEVVRSFEQGRCRLEFEKTRGVISTIIAAKESLDNGGKTVDIRI